MFDYRALLRSHGLWSEEMSFLLQNYGILPNHVKQANGVLEFGKRAD